MSSHKVISGFVNRNISGQNGVRHYIQSAEIKNIAKLEYYIWQNYP